MGVLPAEIVKITAHAMYFIAARQRSCGKVMFTQVSVCPRGVDGISGPMSFPGVCGYLWYQVPSVGGGYVHGQGLDMSRRVEYVQGRGYSTPRHGIQRNMVDKRAVRILLECFPVIIRVESGINV